MKNYGLSISNDALAILANSNVSVRDRAIFMILAESGLRTSELTKLDRASILPQSCVIRNGQVQTCGHGKIKQGKYGCRVREFFVGPAAFAALEEYQAANLTYDIEQPMFYKRDGRRLPPHESQ
jgi:site-specific recombinase XerC